MKKGYKYTKKGAVYALLVTVLVAVAGYFVWDTWFKDTDKHSHFYSYQQFNELIEAGKVEEAVICADKIKFKVTDDPYEFYVENPESPLLKEKLLVNGVRVKVQKSGTEYLTLAFDVIFYAVFAFVFIMVFRKFISPNTFKVVRHTGKTFKDVVGMEALKQDMVQVMDIMQHPAEWAKKGVRMPKGIIMEGAPGNGKTLFAKALAGEAKVNFIPAKATDFESMFMAIGPMKVKLLFKKARRRAPCIVFIDEFDGIGTRRNYSGSAIETENTRIVTALLNELDGFEPTSGVLVLAATNSIAALDEALIRPGRFDARVTVPYPDEKAREQLVVMYTNGKNFSPECDKLTLVRKFNGFSCAKIESVLNRAVLIAGQNERSLVEMGDIDAAVREFSNAR